MRKISFLLIVLFATTNSIFAQASKSTKDNNKGIDPSTFARTITSENMKKHLTILASDEYEGRETGTPGNEKAAQYISNFFKQLGLPTVGENNTYFQPVSFNWTMWNKAEIMVGGEKFKHLWQFLSFPSRNGNQPSIDTKKVFFLGYGIDDSKYSDYNGKSYKGKVIMIYKGEPKDANGNSYITGSAAESEWSTNWEKKMMAAKKHGVKAVLIIENEIQKMLSENRRFLVGPRLTMGTVEDPSMKYANSLYISSEIAKKIMGTQFSKVVASRDRITATGKPQKRVKLKSKVKIVQDKNLKQLTGNNVLGFIEGSDPKLKEEVIVVTAHYDHLGRREEDIYNGADDNGSGTTTVMEVAEALAAAKKEGKGPRRSILTMLVTGEEKGLLGSKYYADHPIYPLENTVANINVDMVGRVDSKYEDNPNYIYVIGSDRLSTELHDINEAVNKQYTNLVLDYTYNADDDPNRYYYRSDHYNFAEKGIPAIFYFNGTHADYHRTTDTVEKINFEKMEKIGRLVFYTAWELANRDKRIEVNVTGRN